MAKSAMTWDSMNKDSTPIEKLVAQFDAFNRSEGKTVKTVSWHSFNLRLLIDYLKRRNIEPV